MKIERIVSAAKALRALDVEPAIYTFPDPDKGDDAARYAARAAEASGVHRVIVDAEPAGGLDWTAAALDRAGAILRAAGLDVAWTTFYRRRITAFRWPAGAMYLQVYTRIHNADDLREAIRPFAQGGREIVLCIGTHRDDDRVAADVATAAEHGTGPSVGVWCLATTSKAEGEALRAWAVAKR